MILAREKLCRSARLAFHTLQEPIERDDKSLQSDPDRSGQDNSIFLGTFRFLPVPAITT